MHTDDTQTITSFFSLADETILFIFSLCHIKDLAALAPVCKRFNEIACDNAVWKHFYKQTFFVNTQASEIPIDHKKSYKESLMAERSLSLAHQHTKASKKIDALTASVDISIEEYMFKFIILGFRFTKTEFFRRTVMKPPIQRFPHNRTYDFVLKTPIIKEQKIHLEINNGFFFLTLTDKKPRILSVKTAEMVFVLLDLENKQCNQEVEKMLEVNIPRYIDAQPATKIIVGVYNQSNKIIINRGERIQLAKKYNALLTTVKYDNNSYEQIETVFSQAAMIVFQRLLEQERIDQQAKNKIINTESSKKPVRCLVM